MTGANCRPKRALLAPPLCWMIGTLSLLTLQWHTVVANDGDLLLSRKTKSKKKYQRRDPAMIEVFNNRFTAVAEQMGEMLHNTATSVNIRERLDFSCALFDGNGRLVANAPHMPVHLGSMSESVCAVLKKQPPGLLRGDVFMLNSPYEGGTHLPDITLIRAGILDNKRNKPDYFVAARGHHADIGGNISRLHAGGQSTHKRRRRFIAVMPFNKKPENSWKKKFCMS